MEDSITRAPATEDWRLKKRWFTYPTLFARLTVSALQLYYYPQVKLISRGVENLPAQGPFILAVNHISNDDAPIISVALKKRRYPFYMAKRELFFKYEWLYRQLGAFPVHRGEFDQWAFDHVGKVLQAGQMCVLFAEGTRQKGEKVELRKAKTGTVRLSLHYNVPVVPCAMIGQENLSAQRFKGWKPVTVNFNAGKLIDIPAIAPAKPYSKEVYQELTTLVMKEIAAMLPEENRGYYA